MTGGGIPDSNFCGEGVEGWIEFKQTGGWKIGSLQVDQIGWHLARHRAGGRTFIVTRRWHDGGPRKGPAVDELWMHAGKFVGHLGQDGLQGAAPLLKCDGGPSRWDWAAIRQIILYADVT